MGKSQASGQVWLDPQKTSPFEFFQHWINIDDANVARELAVFTFLPLPEIRALTAAGGASLREAKRRLALGGHRPGARAAAAADAERAAQALFGGGGDGSGAAGIPTVEIDRARLSAGIPAVDLLVETGLVGSRNQARQLIEGGGAYLHDERLDRPPGRRGRPPGRGPAPAPGQEALPARRPPLGVPGRPSPGRACSRRARRGRSMDAFFNVFKPRGPTSHDVVARLRRARPGCAASGTPAPSTPSPRASWWSPPGRPRA